MLQEAYYYYFTSDVSYYQCDVSGRMKLTYILRLIERAASEHLEVLGLPYEVLLQEGQVFLLAKLGLHILRCPTAMEHLVVQTVPQVTKGAQFSRQIRIYNDADELLVEAHTVWLLIEPRERKILRPSHFTHEIPTVPEELELERMGNVRIRPDGETISLSSYTVRYSSLDVNHHLNNTVYGDIVTDCLPYEVMVQQGISRFVINYQHEALMGETIDLKVQQDAQGWYYITGTKQGQECFIAKVLPANGN